MSLRSLFAGMAALLVLAGCGPESSEPRTADQPQARLVARVPWVATVWAICDEATGNLVYIVEQGIAVVPGGCKAAKESR